jgi:hypothetical protein
VARATRAATRVAQASRLPPVVHAEEPSGQDVSTPSIQPSNPAATLEAARGLGCAGQTTAPTRPDSSRRVRDPAPTAGSAEDGDHGGLQWMQVVSGTPLLLFTYLYIPIRRHTLLSSPPPFSADPSQQQQLSSLDRNRSVCRIAGLDS